MRQRAALATGISLCVCAGLVAGIGGAYLISLKVDHFIASVKRAERMRKLVMQNEVR